MLDIEDIMTDIESIMKTNIPVYVTNLNSEKGDNLLQGNNAFLEEAYYTWYLTDRPPYRIAFLQSLVGDPKVQDSRGGETLTYTIGIYSIIRDTNDASEMPKIKMRYNRILRQIVKRKIATKYPDTTSVRDKSYFAETQDGAIYEFSGIEFTVNLIC